jgi:hypothetical protein
LGDNALLAMGAAPGIAYGDYRFVFGLRAGSASDGQRGA